MGDLKTSHNVRPLFELYIYMTVDNALTKIRVFKNINTFLQKYIITPCIWHTLFTTTPQQLPNICYSFDLF